MAQSSISSANWKVPGSPCHQKHIYTVERRKIPVTNPLQAGTRSHFRLDRSNELDRFLHSQNKIARLPFVSRFSIQQFVSLPYQPIDRILLSFPGERSSTIFRSSIRKQCTLLYNGKSDDIVSPPFLQHLAYVYVQNVLEIFCDCTVTAESIKRPQRLRFFRVTFYSKTFHRRFATSFNHFRRTVVQRFQTMTYLQFALCPATKNVRRTAE